MDSRQLLISRLLGAGAAIDALRSGDPSRFGRTFRAIGRALGASTNHAAAIVGGSRAKHLARLYRAELQAGLAEGATGRELEIHTVSEGCRPARPFERNPNTGKYDRAELTEAETRELEDAELARRYPPGDDAEPAYYDD